MQLALIIAISVHILAATFWAGSTFALARMAGHGSEQLFVPQLLAAVFAIGAGAYLWHVLHEGSFGTMEQIAGGRRRGGNSCPRDPGGGYRWRLRLLRRPGSGDNTSALSRVAVAQRGAAILLAIAAVTMAAGRYA
ncbi:hypothetical protein [Mesorhizobium sp. M1405]|uniref:hypothetical protein n=1 Tax=unclassified Mesorhizobium TaxID=325217 RepID=UPI00333BD84B